MRNEASGRMRLALLAGTIACTLALPARAEAPTVPEPESWRTVLGKALAFETMSSALETGVFLGFYGTAAGSAGGIFLASLATSSLAYVAHEYIWDIASPTEDPGDPGRITAKTLSYRVVSTLRSFAMGNVLGGAEAATSAAFALTVAVADSALYAATEYVAAQLHEAPAAAPPAR